MDPVKIIIDGKEVVTTKGTTVIKAAADAGASLLLRERYRAAADHPVRIEFPEGEYLKGLLLEKC